MNRILFVILGLALLLDGTCAIKKSEKKSILFCVLNSLCVEYMDSDGDGINDADDSDDDNDGLDDDGKDVIKKTIKETVVC